MKIGIHWQGSKGWDTDRRSIALMEFEPLSRVPGVTLLSLQKNDGVEQLAALGSRFAVVDFGDRLDASGAFMDTAAIMKQLDVVVTCDTATAHVAGGLGVPVWLALTSSCEWRWMWGRQDSPWYPTMRLFRQTTPGDWAGVFERMAAELASLIRPTVTIE